MVPTRRSLFLAAWLGGASMFAQPAADSDHCSPVTPESIAWSRLAAEARAAAGACRSAIPPLPALPTGVAELRFEEFFGPIGDRGLDYTAKIRALHGRRVRIAGFMVNQQVPSPGLLLLTAMPVTTHEIEYGLCDELPPATLHVLVPSLAEEKIPLQAGPLVLIGTLEVGPRAEADGRNSVARLILDTPAAGAPLLPSAYDQTLASNR